MKTRYLLLILGLLATSTHAQTKWINPMNAGFTVLQGQAGNSKPTGSIHRFACWVKKTVNPKMWKPSKSSTALSVHFYSNAPKIKVRYTIGGAEATQHLPATGVTGIDLYSINSNGRWSYLKDSTPIANDTICYTFTPIGKEMNHRHGYEYRLYLPLYNEVTWMEIGVPENSELELIPIRKEKPIVAYSTSIDQRACASHPAMAWTNMLSRSLDRTFVIRGLHGNGHFEKDMLALANENDALLYIIDCLPTLTKLNDEELREKVGKSIGQLRKKHSTPILLVENAGGNTNPTDTMAQHQNRILRTCFKMLQSDGIPNLHYLSSKDLKLPANGTADGTPPNDLGMATVALAYERKIREILKEPKGDISTTQPVTQRREADGYEWLKRHEELLEVTHHKSTKAVILGNSITHFWGGCKTVYRENGAESWSRVMKPAGFQNLGCGWDRIENVLWRVYHGELDGFNADKVVVMIGTNNLAYNSDIEIVEGLRVLLEAVRDRQPKAIVKLVGILPRRKQETRVANLNHQLQKMATDNRYRYVDVGNMLLLENKALDESLFTDGLHPNEKGYAKIAKAIAE